MQSQNQNSSSSNAFEKLTAEQERALELVRNSDSFLLTGHMRPDGDCVGAQAALSELLVGLGKQVVILNPDPVEGPFDYLTERIQYGSFVDERGAGQAGVPEHAVTVMLDGSELSRTGPLEGPLRHSASKKLVVDHHIHTGDIWWDEAFVDRKASATGLLVYRMARALGWQLTETAALGVFTSMVTDTGWFKYSNTDAETLSVAGELVACGVDPNKVYQAIYQRQASAHPRAVGDVLSTLEYHADGRVAIVTLPRQSECAGDLSDSNEILDLVRSVEQVEVVLFLREGEHGTCKLSARSKFDYAVNELAAQFGGGGHAKAAGATLKGDLPRAKRELLDAVLADFAALAQTAAGNGKPGGAS